MLTQREADIEGAMSALHRAVAIHQFYPGTHYLSREAMEAGYGAFVRAAANPSLRGKDFHVVENALRLEGRILGQCNPAIGFLGRLMGEHGVFSMRIEGIIPPEGYAHFIALLATSPEILRRRGGFSTAWGDAPYAVFLPVVPAPSGGKAPAAEKRKDDPGRAQDWSAPLHPETLAEVLANPKLLSRLKAFQQKGPLERELLDLLFRAGEPGDAKTLSVILDRIASIVSEYISTQQYRLGFQTLAFLYREAENQAALGNAEHAGRLWAAIKTILRGPFLHWLTVEVATTREDEDAEVGECLLRFMGEFAAVFVINALAIERSRVGRRRLVSVLVSIGQPALPYALKMFGDQRWFVVRNMIAVVAGIGEPSTMASLSAFRLDPDPRIRREAARALGRFHCHEAEEMLRPFLRDADSGVRDQAVTALAAQGTPSAFEALWREFESVGLGDDEWEVKRSIVDAMGRLPLPETVSFLGELLSRKTWLRKDRWERIRFAAVLSLGEIGGPRALELLRPLIDHADADLRRAAERSLASAEHSLGA